MQIPKQDRQSVRTAAQLEEKYNFRKKFAEMFGLVDDARKAADSAAKAAEAVQKKLTQEEIFNILTNNGQNQGIYRSENGEIYINASYILSGEMLADLIKAGVIRSKDGTSVVIDLDEGNADITGTLTTKQGVDGWRAQVTYNGLSVQSLDWYEPLALVKPGEISLSNLYKSFKVFQDLGSIDGYTTLIMKHRTTEGGTAENYARIDVARDIAQIVLSAACNYNSAIPGLVISSGMDGRNKITGLTPPVDSGDAACKQYVDEQINALAAKLGVTL